ncbi:DUF805 domain-containing protein [Modestobacter marinus]|uniref:DUF805 domain-containing protein n=1 Tax=Modestobacter marinus TaxID=477641 RepID=UPI001C93D886|nr:DUF805 domain-containing protein [Modestobacter marinus]
MNIAQWYVSRGRITRRTFWLYYVLPLALLGILASVADLAMGFAELETTTTASSASAWYSMGPISIAVTVLTLVPSISSTVTRLHDQDKSAVWLLFLLLPMIGWLVLLVLAGFIPGTPGHNKYGPPPVGDRVQEPGYPTSYS